MMRGANDDPMICALFADTVRSGWA